MTDDTTEQPDEQLDARALAERHLGRAGRATSADARAATGTGYAILALADALQAVVDVVRGFGPGSSQADYALVPPAAAFPVRHYDVGTAVTACDLPLLGEVFATSTRHPQAVTCPTCRARLRGGLL